MSDVRYTEAEQRLRKTIAREIKKVSAERRPEWVAQTMGISISKLIRIQNAEPGADPRIIELWRLAQATGQPLGSFAGERSPKRQPALR